MHFRAVLGGCGGREFRQRCVHCAYGDLHLLHEPEQMKMKRGLDQTWDWDAASLWERAQQRRFRSLLY